MTPVRVGVLPDTALSRGGIPSSLWRNPSMAGRLRRAAPRTKDRLVLEAGYVVGALRSPFRPVWNRDVFTAVHDLLDIPVLAVGGIRSAGEVNAILDDGQADLVGIGRPFYAEPDLPARILGPSADHAPTHDPGRCQNSNLCVPAQMLGMKGVCYNPVVSRAARRASPAPASPIRVSALGAAPPGGLRSVTRVVLAPARRASPAPASPIRVARSGLLRLAVCAA